MFGDLGDFIRNIVMWKWLKKFALEIAPPVTATVLGAFVVHQLWPSGGSTPQPAVTPPAVQAPGESAKPVNAAVGEPNATAAVPAAVASPAPAIPVAPKAVRPGRQSSEVAKTAPRDEPPVQRSEVSVLDRAEKALATIPAAKSAGPSLPARVAPQAPAPAVTMQEPVATPASPPPAPPPPVTTAAVPVAEPPPMDPPREIAAPVSAGPIAGPPSSLLPPQNQQAQTKNHNPLRVSHSDRANLADIPIGDDAAPNQAPAAAASADAAPPPPPAKQKNIIENIFAPLQSVLPERMRN
jgi:hypothetical protein